MKMFDDIWKRAPGLYIHRPVTNAQELHDWAKSNGIKDPVAPDEMHVTQLYSKKPFAATPDLTGVTVNGGGRVIKPLGDQGCTVMSLDSPALQGRFSDLMAAGASHDYEGYQPHVTLSYAPQEQPLPSAPDMPIHLGSEVHAPLDKEWSPGQTLTKDATVSDVHVPTAMGKPKRKTFTDVWREKLGGPASGAAASKGGDTP